MSDFVDASRRNAKLVYVITAFENASWSLPIWLLFFTRQLGLSVTGAVALGMTRWAVMAICNVPTGAWADRFGRVKMYRIGQVCYALSFLPFVVTRNLVVLVPAQVLGGFFGSMSIGVLEPLVKDGFDLAKASANKFKHFVSSQTVVLYISRLSAGIMGAWIYSKHPYGPYTLEILILLSAWATSLFLHELRLEKSTVKNNREHIYEALGYVWRHRYLRNFFAATLLTVIATESIWTGLQPYFAHRAILPQYYGLLFGGIALLSAYGAYLSRKIPDNFSAIKVKLYMCASAFVGLLIMLLHSKWFAPMAIIPLGLAFGFTAPVNNNEIQKHTSSKHQSTILSLLSLLYTGFYVTVSVMVGRYVDLFGAETMLRILSIQALICAVVIGFIFVLTNNKHKITT